MLKSAPSQSRGPLGDILQKTMRIILTIAITFFSTYLIAQKKCDCLKVLDYITNQIEKNSASYAHQVIEYKRQNEYNKHKTQTLKIATEITTEKECLGIVQYYLSFLRDSHQKLYVTNEYYPFKSFNDTTSVKKFLQENVENHKLKKNNSKKILGNWHYKNGLFSVQIQKNKHKGREYIGVLTENFNNNNQFLGYKGDLKIEFYKNYKGELFAIFWSFGQKPSSYKVELNGDTLKLGRSLTFYRNDKDIKKVDDFTPSDSTYFKELSRATNYIKINTFDYENKSLIDSIIKMNRQKLVSKENLIIDVRNNGGGSDLSYYPLLPFIMDKKSYQNPIAASSIWVSNDNFQNYYNERYMYGINTKQDSLNADREIEELRKHIGGFEPFVKTTSKIDLIYSYPKKVYIIQNRGVASSTEGFILTAQQSDKVKTYGENTGGYVSYGEWRKLEIPNFPAWISMTQKKMIFYDDSDFETIGIQPDIELNPDFEKDWTNIVQKEIEK